METDVFKNSEEDEIMKTPENLKEAFAGESQANRKYLAFARQAEEEGLEMMARLYRAIAEAETIHAFRHLEVAGGIKTTLENVKGSVEGETYEFTTMYPAFLSDAKAEGDQAATKSFHYANEAEKVHAGHFSKALEALAAGKDFPAESFFLCPVCGNVAENEAPAHCPICGTAGKAFLPF